MDVRFPLGQQILTAPSELAADSWVDFKLRSARWYLGVLRDIDATTGDLDRLVGVEMALDGCISGMSSAFDASVARLIEAAEVHPTASAAPRHKATKPYQYGWDKTKTVFKQLGLPLACAGDVDAALVGEKDDQPAGWLAQLRRIRNQATHRSTINRNYQRGGLSEATRLIVPGLTLPAEPLGYLAERLDRTVTLTDLMLSSRP